MNKKKMIQSRNHKKGYIISCMSYTSAYQCSTSQILAVFDVNLKSGMIVRTVDV